MKITIVSALMDLVRSDFGGFDTWRNILEAAGFERHVFLLGLDDIPDEQFYRLLEGTCKVLDVSLEQAADLFGDYWVNRYSPNVYPLRFMNSKSTKEFLATLGDLHHRVTEEISGAHPPEINLTWEDNNTLVLQYVSQRPLIDIAVGLVKGIAKYYGERVEVKKLEGNKIRVRFLEAVAKPSFRANRALSRAN